MSIDFIVDQLQGGRRFRALMAADVFTRAGRRCGAKVEPSRRESLCEKGFAQSGLAPLCDSHAPAASIKYVVGQSLVAHPASVHKVVFNPSSQTMRLSDTCVSRRGRI